MTRISSSILQPIAITTSEVEFVSGRQLIRNIDGASTLEVQPVVRQCKGFARDAVISSLPALEHFLDAIPDPDLESLRMAMALYALRRKRDAISGRKSLFGEPGWDILLDLFIADRRRTEIQVSSVCLDAGVPSTTILRWIARLEEENLVYREADTSDARRRYVRLTDDGRKLMRNVLKALSSTGI